MPRVIFDAVTEPHFLQHFQVVFGAHAQTLRFQKLVLRFQFCNSSFQFFADRAQRTIEFVRRSHELFGGKKGNDGQRLVRVPGQRIKPRDRFDFVAEEFDPDAFFISGRGIDLDDVTPDAKSAACEVNVVALVQHIDQASEHRFA